MPTQNNHWRAYANKWDRIGSPLRPCYEDVKNFRRAITASSRSSLLLGVTPELSALSRHLTAIDNCAEMISAIWANKQQSVVQGDWLALPFGANAFDSVIGDGCLVLLSYPVQHEKLFQQVKQVLEPGGRFLLRLFVNPDRPESRERVCREALAGKIKSFHAFKWRLLMSIAADSPEYTFEVADANAIFDTLLPNRKLLAARTGWPVRDIDTIDFYRGSSARYSYPPLSLVRKIIPPEFKEIELKKGSYELAERCPIMVLERQA